MTEMKRISPWTDPDTPGDVPDEFDQYAAGVIGLKEMSPEGLKSLIKIYANDKSAREIYDAAKRELDRRMSSDESK